ncbi:hypothetical protein MWH25_07195 [Natroniella acetigena]|uniref:hypothetical protein n=1 Tax=Natroniella acetigena TaxID=52004 RepID=UPI00200A1337|nr:hypothetical protein [Natroniella acetigena]MCK8827526.1 hypothetical protein [Natroniella acetigena]
MTTKWYKVIISVLVIIFLSGCLVFDNTNLHMDEGDIIVAKGDGVRIASQFFALNTYDSEFEHNFDDLINLLDPEQDGEILMIDPINGSRYSKDYLTLEDELENHIFTDEDILKYGDSYKLEFEFGDFRFQEDNIRNTVIPFRVEFKVKETIEDVYDGSSTPELLTDNGTIFFELRRHSSRWWINQITINFRELGAVSIDEDIDYYIEKYDLDMEYPDDFR